MSKRSAIILIIATALICLAIFMPRGEFDKTTYQSRLEQVQANDLIATQILVVDEDISREDYLKIAEGGSAKYQESLLLLDQMESMEKLPAESLKLIADIRQYTELRIEMFDLLEKSSHEDTQEYFIEITELGQRIEALNIYRSGQQRQIEQEAVQQSL